ncbi:MAG: hypothetical protein DRN27_09880 [Thermoplasmata archaeon]|nr:MAG: hypothetical protein DRN27_09880 [Thermoplasmata archaeon]
MISEYTCRKCGGYGAIPQAIEGIKKICTKCNGEGNVDWVSNVVGTPPSYSPEHNLVYRMTMNNIDILVHEIRNQGMNLGIIVDVKIEFQISNFKMNTTLKDKII